MMDHSIVGTYDQYWNMIAKIIYTSYLHRIVKRQSLKSQSSMSAFSKAAMQLRKFQRLEVPAPPEMNLAEEVNRKPNLELGKSQE